MPEAVQLGIIAFVVSWLAMLAMWFWQRRSKDASAVDLVWTIGVGGSAVAAAVVGDGDSTRKLLIGAIVGLWSLRLAVTLVRRFAAHAQEDGRYAMLREELGADWNRWALVFFTAQAVFVSLFSLVAITIAYDPRPFGTAWDIAALAVWACAFLGEFIADWQLARWRNDGANRGRTCRAGLWRYSRHPNYFFEWLQWSGLGLLTIGSPFWWVALIQCVGVLLLVCFVTGIPPSEKRAVQSRGDDYREYQRRTSPFFPWFPKETSA